MLCAYHLPYALYARVPPHVAVSDPHVHVRYQALGCVLRRLTMTPYANLSLVLVVVCVLISDVGARQLLQERFSQGDAVHVPVAPLVTVEDAAPCTTYQSFDDQGSFLDQRSVGTIPASGCSCV